MGADWGECMKLTKREYVDLVSKITWKIEDNGLRHKMFMSFTGAFEDQTYRMVVFFTGTSPFAALYSDGTAVVVDNSIGLVCADVAPILGKCFSNSDKMTVCDALLKHNEAAIAIREVFGGVIGG
jgi:hypothetical protein